MNKFKMINFNDVKDITTEEYFSQESFAADMFNAKYSLEKTEGTKETPAEVFLRIASGLSEMETDENNKIKYRDIWFSLLWEGWWRPGGSIISGVGNPSRISLNNCTTISLNGDSLEDINECDYNVMKCAAFRQGLGVDVSKLRPRGAKINNAAVESTGIVPWVGKIVDNGKYVGQSGRMPALLISLKVDHPDIEEFITAKTEQGVIENANISVQITNDFMKAVENDDDWGLRFDFDKDTNYKSIIKIVKAKELFHLIAKTAHACGEPGFQAIDLMKEGSMVQCVANAAQDNRYEIVSTNACCITKDTDIFLNTGIKKVGDILNKKKFTCITDEGKTIVDKIEPQGKKKIYKLKTEEGVSLNCTIDHKIKKFNGKLVESGNLKKGDLLAIPNNDFILNRVDKDKYDFGFLFGSLISKGSTTKTRKAVGFSINKEKLELYSYLKKLFKVFFDYNITKDTTIHKHVIIVKFFNKYIYDVLESYDLILDSMNKRYIPQTIYDNKSKMIGFLNGVFKNTYKIYRNKHRHSFITICLSSIKLIKQLQKILLYFGIRSVISIDNTRIKLSIEEGEFVNFNKIIKGISEVKKIIAKDNTIDSKKYLTFDSLTYKGIENVYDLINSTNKTFTANGLVISNSEKPLPPYGVCNLASINMEMFSTNEKEYKKELENIIPHLVRLSDNVVTYELKNKLSPIEKQAFMVKNLREIGMGITNLHGWLLKQDTAYDSDEAIEKTENFFKYYAYIVFKSSMELGKEKGNAPAFDLVEDKTEFMNSIYFKNIVNEFFNGDVINITNMRNMAHMSIAPTGSLSNSFPTPCISSGVEPVIGLYYWRKTRAINTDVSYTYYFVIPNRLKDFILNKMDKNTDDYKQLDKFPGSLQDDDGKIGKSLIKIISKYLEDGFFKPAHEINYLKKIKLMSKLYNWVDAAISCTYNLSSFATVKDVETIYMEAYKQGVRAVSVYVDGCRSGILIFESPVEDRNKAIAKDFFCAERPDRILLNCAPKRPKEIECNIHQVSIKGEVWTVLVGLLNGLPFEIFCGQAEELYIPKNCKQGKIIKQGKSKYSLEVMIRKSMIEYKNLAYVLMTNNERALTRLLSLNLRHGIPLQFIVDQLKKSNGDITAFATAISRVLSIYIKEINYLYKKGEKTCPVCGKETMMFRGGCMECIECKYSKCG